MQYLITIPAIFCSVHQDLNIGALTFTGSTDLTGSRAVVRIGTVDRGILYLDSATEGSRLTWSGGILSAWSLTPAELASIHAESQHSRIEIDIVLSGGTVIPGALCEKLTINRGVPTE